jgi:hypothetical protein
MLLLFQTLINSTSIMASLDFSNNNNNNNNGDTNPDNIQQQREIFDAAEKRAKSATNILKSMSDLRDTGKFKSLFLIIMKQQVLLFLPSVNSWCHDHDT